MPTRLTDIATYLTRMFPGTSSTHEVIGDDHYFTISRPGAAAQSLIINRDDPVLAIPASDLTAALIWVGVNPDTFKRAPYGVPFRLQTTLKGKIQLVQGDRVLRAPRRESAVGRRSNDRRPSAQPRRSQPGKGRGRRYRGQPKPAK